MIGGRRFEAPDRPIYAARFKAPAMGAVAGDVIPDSAAPDDDDVLPAQTHADEQFYSIRGRSRFYSPLYNPPIGHGGPTSGRTPGPSFVDPSAGASQFEEIPTGQPGADVQPYTEFPARTEFASSLGQGDVGNPALRYERDYGQANVAAQPVLGPPSWYAAGPISSSIRRGIAMLLRREFMADAQSFMGLRDAQVRKSFYSTTPSGMEAARTNRLTRRSLPSSFGARTEVMN